MAERSLFFRQDEQWNQIIYENYDDYGNVNTGNHWSDDYRETQKNHHGGKGKKEREVLKDIENIYKEEVLHTHVNKTFTFNQFRFRRNDGF